MRIWLTALVAWAGIIFLLSSFPNPPGPRGPEWQSNVAHTIEYAVFGFLAARLFSVLRPEAPLSRVAAAAWALAVLYGISDEFHQSFVANRHASALDVAFDALGAAIGVGLGIALLRFRDPTGRDGEGGNVPPCSTCDASASANSARTPAATYNSSKRAKRSK